MANDRSNARLLQYAPNSACVCVFKSLFFPFEYVFSNQPSFLFLSHSHSNHLKSVYQAWHAAKSESAFNLLAAMLEYDPSRRITAEDALTHVYFTEDPKPSLKYVSPF